MTLVSALSIGDWLKQCGTTHGDEHMFDQYVAAFEAEMIDVQTIPFLTDEGAEDDLKSLISQMGPRLIFKKCAKGKYT